MPRVVSIYLPTLPTDRIRRDNPDLPPEQPVVVIARSGAKRWVASADAAAVAVDVADGIVLDTEGADHLQGGEAMMISGIANRFRPKGLTACFAIADTWGPHMPVRAPSRARL